MLDVREEDVPDDGDDVDVEDAIGLRDPHEVDVLRRRPDAPVELKFVLEIGVDIRYLNIRYIMYWQI